MEYTRDEKDEHLLLLANTFLQTLFYDYNGISGDISRPFGRGGRDVWQIWEDILQIAHISPTGPRNNITGFQDFSQDQIDYARQLWCEVLPFMQSQCVLVKKSEGGSAYGT